MDKEKEKVRRGLEFSFYGVRRDMQHIASMVDDLLKKYEKLENEVDVYLLEEED